MACGDCVVTLSDTGTPRCVFLRVGDLVHALLLLMENYSGASRIHIGVGDDQSIRALAETVRDLVDLGGELVFNASYPGGTRAGGSTPG